MMTEEILHVSCETEGDTNSQSDRKIINIASEVFLRRTPNTQEQNVKRLLASV
jgi:hypothetical protein